MEKIIGNMKDAVACYGIDTVNECISTVNNLSVMMAIKLYYAEKMPWHAECIIFLYRGLK